jgi:hypothetical protein
MFFVTFSLGGKSPKVSVLEADSFQRENDNIILHEFVNLKARQRDFSKILGIPNP